MSQFIIRYYSTLLKIHLKESIFHSLENNWDVLRLCEHFMNKGVVGIDMVGDISSAIGKFMHLALL